MHPAFSSSNAAPDKAAHVTPTSRYYLPLAQYTLGDFHRPARTVRPAP